MVKLSALTVENCAFVLLPARHSLKPEKCVACVVVMEWVSKSGSILLLPLGFFVGQHLWHSRFCGFVKTLYL